MNTPSLTINIMGNLDFYPVDKEEYLREMLDSEGSITVAGMEYMPSDIIKECDPVAWRCMLSDLDDFEEVDGQDYTKTDCDEAREQLQELVDAVQAAQEELDAAIEEAATESDALSIEEARSVLEAAQNELTEVQS